VVCNIINIDIVVVGVSLYRVYSYRIMKNVDIYSHYIYRVNHTRLVMGRARELDHLDDISVINEDIFV
jgi:hypothetical protein